MASKKFNLTKDEAYVLTDALYYYSPSIINEASTDAEARIYDTAIEELKISLENFSHEGECTSRTSKNSLKLALRRLFVKYSKNNHTDHE